MREFLRIEASFPIFFRNIDEKKVEEEIINLRKDIFYKSKIDSVIKKYRVLNKFDNPQEEILLSILLVLKNIYSRIAIEEDTARFSFGQCVDISGGGLKIKTKQQDLKDMVRLRFQLPEEPFQDIHTIARVIEATSVDKDLFFRCEFSHILETDRDEIIRFIIGNQRKIIRKK